MEPNELFSLCTRFLGEDGTTDETVITIFTVPSTSIINSRDITEIPSTDGDTPRPIFSHARDVILDANEEECLEKVEEWLQYWTEIHWNA